MKKNLVIVAVFFCVLIVVGYITSIFHDMLRQKIQAVELEKQHTVAIGKKIIDLRNNYGDLDQYLQSIEERYQLASISLPDRMNQGEFINFLQQMAFENKVKILTLIPENIEPLENETNIDQLPIMIKIECGYVNLINFLKAIETSERMMNLKNVSIVSKDDGEFLICDIKMVIFSIKSVEQPQ